jgi:plastocyanin
MRPAVIALSVCVALGPLGCGGGASTTAPAGTAEGGGETDVSAVAGNQFDPSEIAVADGDTVVWTNEDSIVHNVTSMAGADFESGELKPGDTFEWKAAQGGEPEVAYVCTIHPGMEGTIAVD